jgi:hypothetical protein
VLVTLAGSEKLLANVESANLEVLAAQQALDALYKDMDVRQAQALKTIADNQDAVRDAERTLYNLETESQGYDIDAAYANMILLRDKLERAQEDFEPYQNKPADNTTRAAFLSQLAQAEKEYDAAVRKYNNLLGTVNAIDLSQAEANRRSPRQTWLNLCRTMSLQKACTGTLRWPKRLQTAEAGSGLAWDIELRPI